MEIIKHGNKKTPFYKAWGDMKDRCTRKNNPAYNRYGGRGIIFCDRWNKFENFMEDMLSTYQVGLSLDRIDNDGNYYKENCRWATQTEQNRNKSNTRFLIINGEKKTIIEWAERVGLSYWTIYERVRKGVSMDEVLFPRKRILKNKI